MPLVFDRVFVVVTVVVVLVVIVVVVFADFELDCVFTNSPLRFESVCVETYETQKRGRLLFLDQQYIAGDCSTKRISASDFTYIQSK